MLVSLFIAVTSVIVNAQDYDDPFIEIRRSDCESALAQKGSGSGFGLGKDQETQFCKAPDLDIDLDEIPFECFGFFPSYANLDNWEIERLVPGCPPSEGPFLRSNPPLCPPSTGDPCNYTDHGGLKCSYPTRVLPADGEYCCCGRCLETLTLTCVLIDNSTDSGLWQWESPPCPQVCHPCDLPETPGCEGCIIEEGIDYKGSNILEKPVDSQKACSDLCASTAGGLFWTWAPSGVCHVKNSDSGRKAKGPGFVSGNRQCGTGAEDSSAGIVISGGFHDRNWNVPVDPKFDVETFPRGACSIPKLPDGRERHSISVLGGRLVICGGNRGLSSCISWQQPETSWTHFANMSLDRSDHTALVVEDDIVLIGGASYSYKKRSCRPAGCPLANGEMLKSKKLFVLRHASDRSCALLVNKTEILVIGGYSSRWRKENIGDIASDQPWSSLYPDMEPAEGTHGKVHRYTSAGQFLQDLPDLNHPRAEPACSTFISSQGEEGVLVTGGTGTATTEIFLPSTRKWVEAEPLIGDQYGAKSIGLRAALYQGQVLVLGGKRQHYSAVGNEVFAYDAEADVWTSRAALRTKRCWHAVTAVNLTDLCLGQDAASWQPWGEWSGCGDPCRLGDRRQTRSRSRVCSALPFFGKDQCEGPSHESGTCDHLPECETGYTIVLSSTGTVADYQGSALGEFVKTGEHEEKPYYRQRGPRDLFLFYALGNSTLNSTGNTNGWYVGPILGDSGNSDNSLFSGRDTPSPPGDQWQFYDWDEETWSEVDNSFTLEYNLLAPCQSLRVSGHPYRALPLGRGGLKIVRESFGEYRLEAERWSYGRPVYQKIGETPQELLIAKGTWQIRTGTSQERQITKGAWQIRRSTGEKSTNIRSGKGTNSPASRHAGPSALDDTQNWLYLNMYYGLVDSTVEGGIRVTCV